MTLLGNKIDESVNIDIFLIESRIEIHHAVIICRARVNMDCLKEVQGSRRNINDT